MNHALNQKGYILSDEWEIEEISYRAYLEAFGSDETTTPRGVAPRLHIRENDGYFEIWSWGVNGNHPFKIATYDTEEEAKNIIYESFESYISEKNWGAPVFYEEKDELIRSLADLYHKDIAVIRRLFNIIAAKKERKALLMKEIAQKREKQKKEIVYEASFFTPDDQFVTDVRAASLLSGTEKSARSASAMKGLMERNGILAIKTDFWQVYKIVKSKIM